MNLLNEIKSKAINKIEEFDICDIDSELSRTLKINSSISSQSTLRIPDTNEFTPE